MCRLAGCKGNVVKVFNPTSNYQVLNRYSNTASYMVKVKGMVYQECESCSGLFPDQETDTAIKMYVKNNPDERGPIVLKDRAEEMGIKLPTAKKVAGEKKTKLAEKPVLPPKVAGGKPADLPSDIAKAFEVDNDGE